MSPRFATDVITFYHPGFWGLDSADADAKVPESILTLDELQRAVEEAGPS